MEDVYKNSKYEIGILEIRRHLPVLYTFCKICKTDRTNVTVFITDSIFSRLKKYNLDFKDYNLVIKKKNEGIYSFLKRVEKICNEQKIDILFINTIHETFFDLFYYINFKPKTKIVVTVHHANAWLKPEFIFDFKHPLRIIDTILSTILIRMFILKKMDAMNFIYSPVKDYVEKNYSYSKPIFTLPTSVYEERKDIVTKNNEKICIVIPGLIQEHRKDFKIVLSVFNELFKKYKDKIILYLLGMPVGSYGYGIYNSFKKLKDEGCNVVLYDSFIPDIEFERVVSQCDIILAPIRVESRADNDVKEQYGLTVGSGVIFNSIQYSKPTIVPAEFNMFTELLSSTLKYSSEKELENIISQIIDNPKKLKHLQKEAMENSKKFSLKNLQKYFTKEIIGWLEDEKNKN